jgi:4,5-dihydroxyphthalate decarboxylase
MLIRGEIDAIFRPHPPKQALQGAIEIHRLFADPKAEEARYYKKRGFYPIMHIMVFRTEVLERHPHVRQAFMDMFHRIEAATARYYDDPNWSRLAWGRLHLEEERKLLGPNLWPIGIEENRANMEQFINYSLDQGLLPRRISVDELF